MCCEMRVKLCWTKMSNAPTRLLKELSVDSMCCENGSKLCWTIIVNCADTTAVSNSIGIHGIKARRFITVVVVGVTEDDPLRFGE